MSTALTAPDWAPLSPDDWFALYSRTKRDPARAPIEGRWRVQVGLDPFPIEDDPVTIR